MATKNKKTAAPADGSARQMAREFIQYFEWLFNIDLTEGQLREIAGMLTAMWSNQDQSEVNLVVSALTRAEQVNAAGTEEFEHLRPQLQVEFDLWVSQNLGGDAVALLQAIGACVNEIIAAGFPPLTRQQANAHGELGHFLRAELTGENAPPPNRSQLEGFAANLAAQWSSLSEEAKRSIVNAPINWAIIRTNWPSMSEDQRSQYRQLWSQALGQTASVQERGLPPARPRNKRTILATDSDQQIFADTRADVRDEEEQEDAILQRGGAAAAAVLKKRYLAEFMSRQRDMNGMRPL